MSRPDPSHTLPRDDSIMLASFEGWNDAGSAASAALDHLCDVWNAQEYASIDPEEYYDFQVSRPTVSSNDLGIRIVSWPGTVVSTTPPVVGSHRRVCLVRGIEPSMRWRSFAREVLDHAEDLDVTTLITCGALLVDSPHTRPLPTFITSDHPDALPGLAVERSDYEGPTGITGILAHEATTRGMTVISIWVGVPHYVGHPPSPKATVAMLRALESILGDSIDCGELEIDADAWQTGVDELSQQDEEVAAHVRQLEALADTTSLPEASGEAIAAEFERFLRRRDQPS
jgi:hypothetical protein